MSVDKLYNNLSPNNTLISILDSKNIPENSKILIIFDLPSHLYIDFIHVFNSIELKYQQYDFYLGSHKNFFRGSLNKKEVYVNSDITLTSFQSPQSLTFGQKYNINILNKDYDFIFNIRNDNKSIEEIVKTQIGQIEIQKYDLTYPITKNEFNTNKQNIVIIAPEICVGGKITCINRNIIKFIYQQISSKGFIPILFKLPESSQNYNFIPDSQIIQSSTNYDIYIKYMCRALYCFSAYNEILKISNHLYPNNTSFLNENEKYNNNEFSSIIDNFQLSSLNNVIDDLLKNIKNVYLNIENLDKNSEFIKPQYNEKLKQNLAKPKSRVFEQKREVLDNNKVKTIQSNRNNQNKKYFIYNKFINTNTVIFGPMLMEMGWETMLWSGFIKKYKADNPDKNVIVQTREDRKALYEGYVDEIITFNIKNDYLLMSPRSNINKNLENTRDKESLTKFLLNDLKTNYSDFVNYDFSDISYSQNPIIDLKENLYDFESFENSKKIINNIINKNLDKKIVFLYSRHRKDLDDRNISVEFWHQLYKKLSDFNDCLFLLSGKSPSYIKPKENYKNIINLENLEDETNNVNILNLSIEALRRSKYSFGLQSSMLLLSRILKVPSLYIGYDKKDMSHAEFYNPFAVETYNISPEKLDNNMYTVDMNKVMNKFKWFLGTRIKEYETNEDLIFDSNNNLIKISNETKKNTWIDKKGILHIRCMNGNGDLWWSYTKAKYLSKKLCFHLCAYYNPDEEKFYEKSKNRSIDLLDMLGVDYVIENVSSREMNIIHTKPFPINFTYNDIMKYIKQGTEYSLCLNYHLENGIRLKEIFPTLNSSYEILDVENHLDYNKELVDKCDKNTVFIHVATYGKSKISWADINDLTFLELVKKLHENKYKIGLSGRLIDNINWDSVISSVIKITKEEPILIINEHISTCLDAVKKSRCVLGPINGFLIIALTQGTNVFSLWPNKLNRMVNTISNDNVKCLYEYMCIDNSIIMKQNIKNTPLINEFISWNENIRIKKNMSKIFEEKKNEYICEYVYTDLNKLYTIDYEVEHQQKYYNDDILKIRREYVSKFVDVNKIVDYGCGRRPFAEKDALMNYDPYIERFNKFDLKKFNSAKAICFFDVLEHIFSLQSFVRVIPHNMLITSIPIYPDKLSSKNIEELKKWKHYRPEQHNWYFTTEGFKNFMKKYGGWNCIYESKDEEPIRTDITNYVFVRNEGEK